MEHKEANLISSVRILTQGRGVSGQGSFAGFLLKLDDAEMNTKADKSQGLIEKRVQGTQIRI